MFLAKLGLVSFVVLQQTSQASHVWVVREIVFAAAFVLIERHLLNMLTLTSSWHDHVFLLLRLEDIISIVFRGYSARYLIFIKYFSHVCQLCYTAEGGYASAASLALGLLEVPGHNHLDSIGDPSHR
jgi:hypothetical protein